VERDDGNLSIDLKDLDLGDDGQDAIYTISLDILHERWEQACLHDEEAGGEEEEEAPTPHHSNGNQSNGDLVSWRRPKPPSGAVLTMLTSLLGSFPEHGRKAYAAVLYLFASILGR